jgi:hypothetical protein
MEDHGRRVQRKRGVRFNGGVVPAVLPIPAHGKHVIGENLTETQPGLIRFRFELVGRSLAQRYFEFLVEHLSTLSLPVRVTDFR